MIVAEFVVQGTLGGQAGIVFETDLGGTNTLSKKPDQISKSMSTSISDIPSRSKTFEKNANMLNKAIL